MMPLISTGQAGFLVFQPPLEGVAYRMQVEGKSAAEFILALATKLCLEKLEPNELIDSFNVVQVADSHRTTIEIAARTLYDKEASLEKLANGQPFIRVTSDDV